MSKPFCAPSNVEIENHKRNGKAESVRTWERAAVIVVKITGSALLAQSGPMA